MESAEREREEKMTELILPQDQEAPLPIMILYKMSSCLGDWLSTEPI